MSFRRGRIPKGKIPTTCFSDHQSDSMAAIEGRAKVYIFAFQTAVRSTEQNSTQVLLKSLKTVLAESDMDNLF